MKNDEIQIWMLIAFIAALILSFYKVYIMFNKPAKGIDTKTQYKELSDIISSFLKNIDDPNLCSEKIYDKLVREKVLENEEYKNFNLNRFNQIVQQLFYTYEVYSLPELIEKIKKN